MKERCGNNAKDQLMLMIGMSSLYSTADILDSYNNRNMVWGGLTASCAAFYKIGQVKVALTSFSKKSSLYDPYRFTTLLTKGAKLHNTFKKICGFQMLNDLPLMNVPVFETFASQLIHAIAKKNLSMEECYQMIDKSGSDLLKKMFDDFVALKPYEKKCKKILTIIDKKASAYDSQ
jgi:hypothetical protein